jgi:hypothetical protein
MMLPDDSATQAHHLTRAILARDPLDAHLRKSFATLSKHRANGGFDHYAALRLLYNNTRSLCPHDTAPHIRRKVAERLFQHWQRGLQ